MSDALWTLTNVSLGRGSVPRLRDVTLTIQPGITAVLGCSGAGKSSLLNLLVGFEQPDAGAIQAAQPRAAAPHRLPLYWLPQNGGLWPHLTVREHLALATPPGRPAMTDLMGLRPDAYPHELSHGERSRLALLRALAADAATLVMDEPLASVDLVLAGALWSDLPARLAAEGRSLVYSTHLPQMVIGQAERVICLREGRVLYAGEVNTLYRDPPSREAAECLGEVNWLTPEEARTWLGREEPEARCFRPEQICVASAPSPAQTPSDPSAGQAPTLRVIASRFRGAIAEIELRDEQTGARRRFVHRPSGNGLHPGARVRLKVVLMLILALIVGCSRAGGPALPVKASAVWPTPPQNTTIPGPRGLATGLKDETLVLDTVGRLLIYDAGGRLVKQWLMPEYSVGKPEGLVVLKDGRIVVADTHYHRLVYFAPDGQALKMVGRRGKGPGEFIFPVGITRDEQENLYVTEYGDDNDRVQKFTREGEFLAQFGGFGTRPEQFQRPSGIAWRAGMLYVADAMNNRIAVYTDGGKYAGSIGRELLDYPYDVKAGIDGALYVVEYRAGRVTKMDPSGRLLGRYGRTGTGHGEFKTPWGITVDSRLRVKVADTGNKRVVELEL